MWDLAPLPGIEPGPPALGVQSIVSHWTAREALSTLTYWPPGLSEQQSLLIGAAQFAGMCLQPPSFAGMVAWPGCCVVREEGLSWTCPWHQSLPPVCFSTLRRTLFRGGLCPEPTPDPKAGVRPSFLRGWVRGGGGSEAGPEEAPGTAAQPAREGFTFFGSAVGQAICLNNPKENHLAELLSF